MPRRPKLGNEYTKLATTARLQLKRADALGKSLDERVKVKKEPAADWIPDEDWRRDFAAVTVAIQHAGNSLVRALEGNKKELGGLNERQLEEQFIVELTRGAQAMTDEEWAALVAAREKRPQ